MGRPKGNKPLWTSINIYEDTKERINKMRGMDKLLEKRFSSVGELIDHLMSLGRKKDKYIERISKKVK